MLTLHRSTLLADTRTSCSVRARASAMAHQPLVRVGLANEDAMTRQPIDSLATPLTPSTARLNAPNAITMAGYGLTLAWLAGGSWPLAVAGLIADEADGYVARKTDETSDYGSLLDWAVDLSLTGLVLAKLGMPWLLLAVTPLQVYLRERGWAPRFGSWRAVFTVIAIGKGV